MDEKLSIRLNIGDEYYSMNINREEEEVLRKASSIINERLTNYKKKYTTKKNVDLLAFIALQSTKDFLEIKEKTNLSTINDDLKLINADLEEYLNQNK